MDVFEAGAQKLGFKLTSKQLAQFELYYGKLSKWNRRINLTSITEYRDFQIKHLLDSLTVTMAFSNLADHPPENVIDIGTGAGFPGLPLKIIMPSIRLTLVESVTKKTEFLKYIVAQLALRDIEITTARAEEIGRLDKYREKYDLALSRAVAALPTLLELTIPLCRIGGIFVAQKQARAKPEIDRAAKAIRTLGARLREIIDVNLTEFPDKRILVVFDKISSTPTEYPRRPGIPLKNPIVYT